MSTLTPYAQQATEQEALRLSSLRELPENVDSLVPTAFRTGADTPWYRVDWRCVGCGRRNPDVTESGNLAADEAEALRLAARPCRECETPERRAERARTVAQIRAACARSEEAGR